MTQPGNGYDTWNQEMGIAWVQRQCRYNCLVFVFFSPGIYYSYLRGWQLLIFCTKFLSCSPLLLLPLIRRLHDHSSDATSLYNSEHTTFHSTYVTCAHTHTHKHTHTYADIFLWSYSVCMVCPLSLWSGMNYLDIRHGTLQSHHTLHCHTIYVRIDCMCCETPPVDMYVMLEGCFFGCNQECTCVCSQMAWWCTLLVARVYMYMYHILACYYTSLYCCS